MAEEGEEIDLQMSEFVDAKELDKWEFLLEGNEKDRSLPVYSMAGISSPRTMRLKGVTRGSTITVLIDSGASHYFISASLVPLLQLRLDKTTKFGVQLGDGMRQKSEGVCKEVSMSLQGCEIVADYYVFVLGGVNIILGVAWLAKLGDVKVSWETMSMAFA